MTRFIQEDGNPALLPSLKDAMQYHYKVKQMYAIDGSTVLPYNQMNADVFHPSQTENIDTKPITKDKSAKDLAPTMLSELCDPKKDLSE